MRALAVVLAVSATMVQGQTTPAPNFDQALLESRRPLVLTDGKFSGAGAVVLEAAVQRARFVMLGEDHFTREIPSFAAALCDMMHPDAYAVEAGPYAAKFVNGLLRNPDRIAQMAARLKAYPSSIGFLDIRQENDLAAHYAASSRNPGFALWGLDQEYMGAAGALLEAMTATQPGPRSREALARAQEQERAAEIEARRTGDYGKLFLLASSDADVAALQSAVDADGNARTRDLLHEFVSSRNIYRSHMNHSPDSNLIRAELLKQHFLADYLPLERRNPAARVFFKLGDNHTGKGFNYTHELNLGNFVAEFAAGEQAESLHLFVLGARGTHYVIEGYGKPIRQKPFVMSDDPEYGWLGPAITDLLPQQTGTGGTMLTLFDLRQLRYRGLKLSSEWEHVIYSYDLCVLMPELTVASAIE